MGLGLVACQTGNSYRADAHVDGPKPEAAGPDGKSDGTSDGTSDGISSAGAPGDASVDDSAAGAAGLGAAGTGTGGAAGTGTGTGGAAGAVDAAVDAPVIVDAPPEVLTCPPEKPVLDNGVCCATGQRNCGGTCVACAAGSVCSGNTCGCPSTSQCAPAVPSGWLGPVAADLSGQNAACAAAYPTSIAAGTSPQGAAATCSCTCGSCAGGSCNVYFDSYSTDDCSGPPDDTVLLGDYINACNTSTPNSSLYTIRGVASKTGATCGVTRNSVTAAPPSWSVPSRLCTGATVTPGACGGGAVCAPLTAPKKTCIYHTGAAACPAGYPVTSMQFTGFADSRDCTCGCNASGASCVPTVSYIDTTAGCTGDTGVDFGALMCGTIYAGATHGFRVTALNTTVTGTTTQAPTGAVVGASPITVCCTN